MQKFESQAPASLGLSMFLLLLSMQAKGCLALAFLLPAFTAAPRHIHAPLFACRACTHAEHPVFAAHVASLHLLLMYCLTNFLTHPTTKNRM